MTGPGALAMFLDFDGTLVDFADHPDDVELDSRTLACVRRIYDRLDGALAIVTGRDIASVDRFFAPHLMPVAGVHGLVRRDVSGRVHSVPLDEEVLAGLASKLQGFAARHPGLLVERKPGAVVLHHRRRPDLAGTCLDRMERLTGELGGVTLMRGKAVIEARAGNADKGGAIAAFLKEPPFAGRCPVFAGDDVTDEHGFARVNALGGVTIKVGPGPTCARYRVPQIGDFRRWLCETARRFEERDGA
ncbi:MAG: trehalose-phosphatase [Alphaproteobacteria bacterium]